MATKPLSLAVIGANSTSGETLLEVLGATSQSFSTFFPLALEDEGEMVEFRGQDFPILALDEFNWQVPDLVVFCGEDTAAAAQYATIAAEAGAAVVDLSGGADAPLAEADARLKKGGVARLPHQVTTILLPVLKALAKAAPFSGLTVTAMLSVSQDGKPAIDELSEQTRALFAQSEVQSHVYPKRMAFNLHPVAGAVDEYGASVEEQRIINEVASVFADVPMSLTCARVPMFFGHGISLNVRFAEDISLNALKEALSNAEGVYFLEAQGGAGLATPQDVIGGDKVWVSRVRASGQGVSLWLAGDNTRLGAMAVLRLLGAAA